MLLHERLVPYIRAAAATAARSGLPIMRPLCLVDPEDPEGWEIADAYLLGPSLWVAPVLEEGATERRTYLPRGEWLDWWTGERLEGGRWIEAEAPLDRIPLWVRSRLARRHLPGRRGRARPRRGGPGAAAGGDALGRAARSGHVAARLADGTRDRLAAGRVVGLAGAPGHLPNLTPG